MSSGILDPSNPAAGVPAGDVIKDTDTAHFMADVIDASQSVPVIVDFWAPWCGPCKQLTPMLERAVTNAQGRVKLVKVNIDENQEIASQMRVQSIPAVFAFKDGRPVDGFMGAQPESQIKKFIEKLIGGVVEDPVEALIEAAGEALEAGDINTAGQAYAQALQHDRENPAAIAGLAKCQIEAGDLEGAKATLALTPPAHDGHADIASARAILELAETPVDHGEIAALQDKIEDTPGDHDSRLALAIALNASGEREAALDHIFHIIQSDREWNDQAARQQLLKFFDAWGPADELTIAGRRRLSSLLFS